MQSNAAKHGKLSKVFAAIWLETAGACSSVLRHASFLSDPEQRSKRASKQFCKAVQAKLSNAKQSYSKQSKPKQSKAMPSKAKQSNAKQSKAKQGKAKQS